MAQPKLNLPAKFFRVKSDYECWTKQSRFSQGEVLELLYYQYNSYDGFYMFFFNSADPRRVFCGQYNQSEQESVLDFYKFFEPLS